MRHIKKYRVFHKNIYSHRVSIRYIEKKQSNTLKRSQQVFERPPSTSIHAATRLRLLMKTLFYIVGVISTTASVIRVFSSAIVVGLCLKTLSFTYPKGKSRVASNQGFKLARR